MMTNCRDLADAIQLRRPTQHGFSMQCTHVASFILLASLVSTASCFSAGVLHATSSQRTPAVTAGINMNAAATTASVTAKQGHLARKMADLEELALPEVDAAALVTQGIESSTRDASSNDQGCVWTETPETVMVELQLQGLRGQPAAALAVHLDTSRDAQWRGRGMCTVTAFGRVVWSCVLRGPIDVEACSFEAEDGAQMLPLMRVTVRKMRSAPRWDGFIDEIEFNTLI